MRRLAILAFLTTTLLLLVGCGGPSALLIMDKDRAYSKAIDHTRFARLTIDGDTLGLFRATYLPPLYPDSDYRRAYFFIGLYLEDDRKGPEGGLHHPRYHFTINDDANIRVITPLGKASKLYQTMPLVDSWKRYYLVGIKPPTSGILTLTITRDNNASATVRFPVFQQSGE